MNVEIIKYQDEPLVVFRPKEHSPTVAESINKELEELGLSSQFRVRFKMGNLQILTGRNHWTLIGEEKTFWLRGKTFRGGHIAWQDCSTELDARAKLLRNKNFIKG